MALRLICQPLEKSFLFGQERIVVIIIVLLLLVVRVLVVRLYHLGGSRGREISLFLVILVILAHDDDR